MINKKKKIELSYNSKISVDHKSEIIITNSVTQQPTDYNQIIPQIKIIETIGPILTNTCINADNGFFTQDNIAYIYKNRIDAYIPNRQQVKEAKTQFKNNKKLPYQMTYKYNDKIREQYYTNECLKCPDQTRCAGKNRIKIITDYGGDLVKMSLKMETAEQNHNSLKEKKPLNGHSET